MVTQGRPRHWTLAVVLSLLAFVLVGPALAAVNPGGNNGTIKIDGIPFDDHPNNEPHPGCIFQVDFYGFDEGQRVVSGVLRAHRRVRRGVAERARSAFRKSSKGRDSSWRAQPG